MIQLYDVPDSDSLLKGKKKRPMDAEEQKYIVNCLDKHGTNFTKMFRDIKTNSLQHTEEKLRKLASRFFLLEDKDLIESIPDRVKELIPK